MNASNADEVCELTPIPSPAIYKNDEASAEEENLSNEPEFFRIFATILVFVAWVYLIVKGYLDYEANRADAPDDGSRNEVEGDRRVHVLYNNANDLETHPTAAVAYGPVQLLTPESAEVRENDPSPVAPQVAPPTERRRRQRSNDVIRVDLLAALDMDEASPAATTDDARAAESVQGVADQDIDGAVKPKKQVRHARKYVRVQRPEDSRSKEPETSDEDFIPSYESKPNTSGPTDECKTKASGGAIGILDANTSVAETQVFSAKRVIDCCGTAMQSAANILHPSDHLEDCQETPSNEQPLENDLEPSYGRNTEDYCLNRIAVLNRHGTSFDEGLIAEAEAKTDSKVSGTLKRDDSCAKEVTQSACHRIIDSLNEKLLEQLTTDLVRRLEDQKVSKERLRQELDIQTRARHEAQSCYAEVVEQVRRFGIEWGNAHPETQEKQEQDQRPNTQTTELDAIQDNTAYISKPKYKEQM